MKPELKNVPMAVGGDEETRHGIILAKNELAKKFNVLTAETIWQAKRKCPELVVVPPHRELYYQYSKQVKDIYCRYTDYVESFGLDEAAYRSVRYLQSLAATIKSPTQLRYLTEQTGKKRYIPYLCVIYCMSDVGQVRSLNISELKP